jgi:hypothetical protein
MLFFVSSFSVMLFLILILKVLFFIIFDLYRYRDRYPFVVLWREIVNKGMFHLL